MATYSQTHKQTGFTPTPIKVLLSFSLKNFSKESKGANGNINVEYKNTPAKLHFDRCRRFTLTELLVVIAIIDILSAVVVVALDRSRAGGRDANRASQMQEFLKAFELYYTDGGLYPTDGVADGGAAVPFVEGSAPGNALNTSGYLKHIPTDPRYSASTGYHYCATNSRNSMYLIINTELDKGGANYCTVSRGPQTYASGICRLDGVDVSTLDNCANRF